MTAFSIISAFYIWAPIIFPWLVFVPVLYSYAKRQEEPERHTKHLSIAVFAVLAFRLCFAVSFTAIQYWSWSNDKFSSLFLGMPLKGWTLPFLSEHPLGYFVLYSFEHYWFNFILSIVLSFAFYLFLKTLEKYRDRFFEAGEVKLGGLLALIAGWPQALIFITFSMIAVVFLSVFRMSARKGRLTTLGTPFLIGFFFTLLAGDLAIVFAGLSSLVV